jgi:rod shape determining protein RodA
MSDFSFMSARLRRGDMSATEKLWQMSWSLIFWLCCIFAFGFTMLLSAANGHLTPWAGPQLVRFIIGLGMLSALAITDIRLILRYAYVFYALVFVLLVVVEVKGFVGGGAQRWVDLGFINLQPSELMKPAIVIALARYFHGVNMEEIGQPMTLLFPMALVFVPAGLVIIQPDLGTALLIIMGSAVIFFMAGVRIWKFLLVGAAGLGAIPIAWNMRPRLRWAPAACSARATWPARKATSTSCPNARPTSSSPCWPRNSAWSAGWSSCSST